MATLRTLRRVEALAWILIYGGLFLLILGIASHGETVIGGWSLSILGSLAAAAGVVLVFVRSRMSAPPARPSTTNDKETPA